MNKQMNREGETEYPLPLTSASLVLFLPMNKMQKKSQNMIKKQLCSPRSCDSGPGKCLPHEHIQ